MTDIGLFMKSLMAPKPSLPAQRPAGTPTPPPTGLQGQLQEEIAFREVRKAIEDNFDTLFRGARFASGEDAGKTGTELVKSSLEIADGILGDLADLKGYDEFKKGFNYVAKPLDVVMDLAKELTGLDKHSDILAAVGGETLSGFYAAVTPYVGCIKGGVGAAKSLSSAVGDVRSSFRAIEALPITNTGAPQVALQAVNVMLDRRANDGFAKGSIQAVEAAVNTALIASGVGGVATGGVSVASKIGVLAIVIRRRGIEYGEMKAGKVALGTPRTLSPAVFGVCPLLGCYLLTGSDTSAIVVSCMGNGKPTKGWMDQVEQNKKFLDPILEKAKGFVTDSVWRVEGPSLSTKASKTDKRPWVERTWVAHFGGTGRVYHVIHGGAKLKSKVGDAYEKISKPMEALVRADLQKIAEWERGLDVELVPDTSYERLWLSMLPSRSPQPK